MSRARPRICVDLTPNEMHDRWGGIGRYATHLCRELAALGEDERRGAEIWGLPTSAGRPLPAADALAASAALGDPIHVEWHRLRRAAIMGARLRGAGVDLFHSTQPGALPWIPAGKMVMTSYDLVPLVIPPPGTPARVTWWAHTRMHLRHRHADHVIAISERTRQDILERIGIAPGRVTTVHLGVDVRDFAPPPAERVAEILAQRELPPRYFVYVGSDHHRKNQGLLFRAWLRVADEIPEAIVLIGKAMYSRTFQQVSEEVRRRGLGGRVIWRDSITDAELPAVYSAATALVTPSLYEGFGMTLLEAMAAGAPVAASRNGAHEEVGRDACLYFDPRDEAELAARLLELSRDEALRGRLRTRGRERAAGMSWSAMARQTMAVYRRVLALD